MKNIFCILAFFLLTTESAFANINPDATINISCDQSCGGGGGSVSSVGLADGSNVPIYAISGSPVTSTGTLTFTLNSESANTVFAGPASGGASEPGFRSLVLADLPPGIPLLPINLASGSSVTGNLSVTNLDSGTNASASTFWSGAGSWSTPNYSSILPINLASGGSVTGNLPVTNLNSGINASASTVWKGNGTWGVGSSIGVGSATQDRIVKWQSVNGTTSAVQGNTNWAESSSTAAISNQGYASALYGSATNPLIDLTQGSGSGVGLYTDATGFLYPTAQGGNLFCIRNNGMFVGACNAATAAEITTAGAGGIQIQTASADNKSLNLVTSGLSNMTFNASAANGAAAIVQGAIGFSVTNQSGTTYTQAYNVDYVNMNNSAARVVTLVDPNNGQIGSGWTINIKDGAGTSGTAGSSIRIVPNSGHTIDGSNEAYINNNYGTLCLYGKSQDWLTCSKSETSGGGGSGVTTIGTLDSNGSSSNGATISGSNLYMQSASVTVPGLVNTVSQSMIGSKDFLSSSVSPNYGVRVDYTPTQADVVIGSAGIINTPITTLSANNTSSSSTTLGYQNINTIQSAGFSYAGEQTGLTNWTIFSGNGNLTGAQYGSHNSARNGGSGTIATATGIFSEVTNTSTGTITNATGLYSSVNPSTGTITNGYGLVVPDFSPANIGYGVWSALTDATNKYNVYASGNAKNYFAGKVLIGSSTNNGSSLQVAGPTTIGGSLLVTSTITAGSSLIMTSVAGGNNLGGSLIFTGGNLSVSTDGSQQPQAPFTVGGPQMLSGTSFFGLSELTTHTTSGNATYSNFGINANSSLTNNFTYTGANLGANIKGIVAGSGTTAFNIGVKPEVRNTGSGTITDSRSIYIPNPTNSGGGAMTNSYGIYMDSQTRGSIPYTIYTAGTTDTARLGGSLSVASDKFRVDSNGDPYRIKNVAYSWPSSQGSASTVLTNDGSGTLSWAATSAGGGSIGVGSATANRHMVWQSVNGTTSVVVKNSRWQEGATNGEFQFTNFSSAKGTAVSPLVDLVGDGVNGAGLYTDASGKLLFTAIGNEFMCMDTGHIYLQNGGTCTGTSANISGGTSMTINGGSGNGTGVTITGGGLTIATFASQNSGGNSTGLQLGGQFAEHYTTSASTSYTSTSSLTDGIVGLTSTAARLVTLGASNTGVTGTGLQLGFIDNAGTAGKAGSSIRIVTAAGQTINGSNEYYINNNYGSAKFIATNSPGSYIALNTSTTNNYNLGGSLAVGTSFSAGVFSLTDGANVSLDASLANTFDLVAAGNRTILAPTNARDGQKIVIRHKASGADRTLSLTTGSAGAFRFGTDITALTATTNGLTDYIGCIFNASANRWDVTAYVKGY